MLNKSQSLLIGYFTTIAERFNSKQVAQEWPARHAEAAVQILDSINKFLKDARHVK